MSDRPATASTYASTTVFAERCAGVGERDAGDGGHRVDRGLDLLVRRREQLRAVAQIDLVAVVLRRVVARRHHDAGVGAHVADRECEHRRRQRTGEDERVQARTGQHAGDVVGEASAPVARVVADGDRAPLAQVRGKARGSPSHDRDVHAVGPRPKAAA